MAPCSERPIVVIGGGLSGLSLAARLAAGSHLSTIVLEPRTAYERDRTWSFWRLVDHPFEAAIAKSWTRWSVSRIGRTGKPRTAIRGSAAVPYDVIPADRLYALGQDIVGAAPHVELRLGCEVTGVLEEADGVTVKTSAGPIEARYVFDSRPPAPIPGGLVQRFLGQEVVADRPVFDPGRVTLMDFTIPQAPGSVRFMYVLPFSETEALVEDTWFAPADFALPDAREAIRAYLGERFGLADYGVTFEETGAIPMSPELQAPDRAGRVISIGAAGGAVKPSSGYAFLNIQRMADAIAADLVAGRPPTPFQPRSEMARWMDAVFLDAIRRTPEEAPILFERLFARCRPEPLIRFLNDVGRPSDVAEVIAAMPKRAMIAAAARRAIAG